MRLSVGTVTKFGDFCNSIASNYLSSEKSHHFRAEKAFKRGILSLEVAFGAIYLQNKSGVSKRDWDFEQEIRHEERPLPQPFHI